MKTLRANLLLLLAAFIWGSSFTAQSVGLEYIEPFTFNGIRLLIGGIVLVPVAIASDVYRKKRTGLYLKEAESSVSSKSVELLKGLRAEGKRVQWYTRICAIQNPVVRTVISGIICGVILSIASSFQQAGMVYTSAGKSGFITALYVILVPICGLFFGRKPTVTLLVSAVLAVCGMYLLCLSETLTIGPGEILTLICALFFTMHILVIDRLSPAVNGIKLSCIQFLTAGFICIIGMFLTETPELSLIIDAGIAILYAGVLSCGVAYTLQVIGQKNTNPTLASLLMSLESVFSVLVAWAVLGDRLSSRELTGCVITFSAVILAQLPDNLFKRKAKERSNG